MKAWRWTLWSLFAWLLLIAAALGGMLMWILAFLGDGLLFVILALLATGAFVYAVRLRHRLDTSLRPESDFAASEDDEVEAPSGITRVGRFAAGMLWVVDWRARWQGDPPRWISRARYALVATLGVLVLTGFLLTGDVRYGFLVAWLVVCGVALLYFALIGLFLPWSVIKRDPSLRSFLGQIGCKSVLGLRLMALVLLAGLICGIVMTWSALTS